MDPRNWIRNVCRAESNFGSVVVWKFMEKIEVFESLELSMRLHQIMTLLFVVSILGFLDSWSKISFFASEKALI